ncbi:MAG: TolC family protein [Candidatus Eisenbacteria bacterium]
MILRRNIRWTTLALIVAIALGGSSARAREAGALADSLAHGGMAAAHAMSPGGALSLEEALLDVAAANPSLQARRAMVTAALRRVPPSGAWEQPMLELGAVNVPLSGKFNDDEMTMKMVGLVQRVPLFGKNGLRRRAADQEAEAEGAAATRSHYEIFGAAIEAYAESYFGLERARAAGRHRGVMDRLVESARARYRSGNGRLEDALRAEAERARVHADAISFAAGTARSLARLDALRGRDPSPDARDLQALPSFAVPADPSGWLAAARDGHPRLLEAEARERRYAFSARAARRMVWPDLEVRASYGVRGKDRFGMALEDMFTATVGFMVPIFAKSREYAMGAEMDAMARGAAAERREAELDLSREAMSLHAEASAASRMVSLLADTVVVVQRRAVEAGWSGYAAGGSDLWRVFELSHSLYSEELQLLDAQEGLAVTQARLVSLTGRGDLAGVELPAIRKEER